VEVCRAQRAFGSLSLYLRGKDQTTQTSGSAYHRVACRPKAITYLRSRKASGFQSSKLFVPLGGPEGCGQLIQVFSRDVVTSS
jgi:hypothetical protein